MTKEERIRDAEERFGDGKPYNKARLLEEIRFLKAENEYAKRKVKLLKDQLTLRKLTEFEKGAKNG